LGLSARRKELETMKLTPWIAASVLALGLSPAVQAQRWGNPNTPYSNRWDGQRTYTAAHEVDEIASQMRYQAQRNNRRPDRREARMLEALYRLDVAASRYHQQLESYRRDPRQTNSYFVALVRAFDDASEALRWVEPRSYVDRGMERISVLLTDMSPSYGRTYQWGRHGHDRYDRNGRYDRNDRDGRYDRDRDGRYDRDDRDDRDDDGYRPPQH
jgi:hypothetical protein